MPFVSVCIVTFGKNTVLAERAVESVLEHASDVDIDIIVVVNGASNGVLEAMKKRHDSISLIFNGENKGYAPAMNMAIRKSRGNYVLCLSHDAELLPNSIQALLEFMESSPKCGLAGPLTMNGNGQILSTMHHPNLFISIWGEIIPVKRWLRRSRQIRRLLTAAAPNTSGLTSDYSATRQVKMLSGGILFSRRKFLDDVGLLDDNMPLGPDDYDWCYRAREGGYEIWYVAESKMIHRQTPKEDVRDLNPVYLYVRLPSLQYFFRKYHRGFKERLFTLSLLILYFKWRLQILSRYGTESLHFEAVQEGQRVCLRPERYSSDIVNSWVEKSSRFSLQ